MTDLADPPPSPTAVRRALARARDGKTLDPTEAEVLLGARGEQLDTLLEHASRVRDAGLEAAGITVAERVAHHMPTNPHNAEYIATKKAKSGHLD